MNTCSGHDELHEIRKWVRSLTSDELFRALEFNFQSDDDSKESSHEYDLLEQMLELQSPPPTPIHPRALFFKPAAEAGATDGRNEEERVKKNRFRRPQLFQFIEKQSTGRSWQNNINSGGKRHRGGTHSRRRRQQLSSGASKRYDVIARKFITPWGDVLSIGCTEDQQQADNAILLGTGIKLGGPPGNKKCCMFCRPRELTVTAIAAKDEERTSLLHMIRISSRGKFLSLPFTLNARNGTRKHYPSQSTVTFCAPWFDPTSQWFSLPMYLASRYEVALWMAFRQKRGMMLVEPLRVQNLCSNSSEECVHHAICKALVHALSGGILKEDSTCKNTRDSILWHLLDCPRQSFPSSPVEVSPLLEFGTKTYHLRLLVHKHYQDAMAQEIQNDLLRGLDVESKPTKNSESLTKKRRPKKKKKRNKQHAILPVVHEENKPGKNCKEDSAADDLSDDCLDHMKSKKVDSSAFPPPSRERNRNTITVLAMIEDIVENVFDRVGLTKNDGDEGEDATMPALIESHVVSLEERNGLNELKMYPQAAEEHNEPVEMTDIRSSYSDLTTDETDSYFENPKSRTHPHRDHQVQSSHRESLGLVSQDLFHSKCGDHHHDAGFFTSPSPSDFALHLHDPFNGWGIINGYQAREKSIFTDFFLRQEVSDQTQDELLMASSTAASIASSSGLEDEDSEVCDSVEETTNEQPEVIEEVNLTSVLEETPAHKETVSEGLVTCSELIEVQPESALISENADRLREPLVPESFLGDLPETKSPPRSPMRSPSPPVPTTPPPQLSPILVSLADLKTLRRRTASGEWVDDPGKEPALVAGSLPSSPVLATPNGLTPSWSREDLRISAFTDDQQLRRKGGVDICKAGAVLSYRNVAIKSLAPSVSSPGNGKTRDITDSSGAAPGLLVPDLPHNDGRRDTNKEFYAQSETALDECRQLNDQTRVHMSDETDNNTTTKDGSTTISSAVSPQEAEGLSSLREERNAFRDMCLTLGAEVAMLKNLLASEKGSKFCYSMEYSQGFSTEMYGPSSYDEFVTPVFQGIPMGITSSRTVGAMSDAGVHRGDHDSVIVSEDGTDVGCPHDSVGNPRAVHIRRISTATVQGSDASMEHTLSATAEFRPLNREAFGSVPLHGLHSRLTKDIMNFLNATSTQLRKQASRRRLATERLSRLITALWPRAQVKLYGSHVSGLGLPSSDLDFVICLPAVHKNAPAVAPGVLEGRNAINETSQKLLARKLKGESWIDPNSIKIVERTIVPVIKVSTKDTRARVVQLDISFDGPEHRGLEAIDMVKATMQELPMIRPLMLVLKQFLLDRGLLTAFTGGLSSYGLFLMITRYLQEQPSSWGDCGSLLMGFLDFYGNCFDPRLSGLCVRQRQYFSRMNYPSFPTYPAEHAVWNVSPMVAGPGPPVACNPEFLLRRHSSFSEKSSSGSSAVVSGSSLSTHSTRPPRFQPPASSSPRRYKPQFSQKAEQGNNVPYDQAAKPYTFDPLFIVDPLCVGNNVGRNAFRIFQVQRAFSDAHRALVASLEWDIYSTSDMNDGVDYPLLKCLLQSEDVFYELDDTR